MNVGLGSEQSLSEPACRTVFTRFERPLPAQHALFMIDRINFAQASKSIPRTPRGQRRRAFEPHAGVLVWASNSHSGCRCRHPNDFVLSQLWELKTHLEILWRHSAMCMLIYAALTVPLLGAWQPRSSTYRSSNCGTQSNKSHAPQLRPRLPASLRSNCHSQSIMMAPQKTVHDSDAAADRPENPAACLYDNLA